MIAPKYTFVQAVLVCLIFASCHRHADGIIRQAEQLMQEQPDSALCLLQRINRHSLSGESLARYALDYSIAQNKSGIDVLSDSLLRIAYSYYSHHPEDSLYARSRYYMGLYYIMADSTKQGEDCLRTAARYAAKRGEYYTQYLALNRLSASVRHSDASQALEYSKQALQVYSEHCPTNVRNKILLLLDVGTAYLLCAGKEDSALVFMDMALEEARQLGDSEMTSAVMQEMSLVYSKQKDYQQALSCAKAAWEIVSEKSINLVSCLANCYADADSIRQARELYAAITAIGSYGQKYLAYKNLSILSLKDHDTSFSLAYTDSAYECMEQMYTDLLKTKADYYQDLIQQEKKNRLQAEEIHHKRMLILCCIMLLVVVALIGVFAYISTRDKARHRLEVEREGHRLREQFAHEQYNRDLANKNAQLAMMRKMVMEKYNFHKRIEGQNKSGKHITLSPKDWQEISAFLDATSDGFPKRLRKAYPHLREKDYQFCMLVRLDFSIKNLANIYGIAEVSLKQKLVTYKERLDIPDRSISFKQFIANF